MNSLDDNDQDEDKSTKWIDNIESKPYFLNPEQMLKEYRKSPGSSLSLKCNVASETDFNITWYKNGNRIYMKDYQNIPNDNFDLSNITFTDSGNYKCVACNDVACIEHTFKVEVTGKKINPTIFLN